MGNKHSNYPFKHQVEALFTLEYGREDKITGALNKLEHALLAAEFASDAQRNILACKSLQLLEDIAQTGEQSYSHLRTSIDTLTRDIHDRHSPDCDFKPIWNIGDKFDFSYDSSFQLLQIKMPVMLPFNLGKGVNYLNEKLQWQLNEFLEQYEQQHNYRLCLSPALVVFVHHYDKQCIALNHVRDYDNLERKCIINALQNTRLLSDNPTRMVDMNLAVEDEHSFTELLISPVSQIENLIKMLDFSLYQIPPCKESSGCRKSGLKE